MKFIWLIIIAFLISFAAFSNPGDSTSSVTSSGSRKLERQKARIERKKERILNRWDERTTHQKGKDKRIIVVLAISAALLARTISAKE